MIRCLPEVIWLSAIATAILLWLGTLKKSIIGDKIFDRFAIGIALFLTTLVTMKYPVATTQETVKVDIRRTHSTVIFIDDDRNIVAEVPTNSIANLKYGKGFLIKNTSVNFCYMPLGKSSYSHVTP